MLGLSEKPDDPSGGRGVADPTPRYKLINRTLMRQLMQRTGSGHQISIRKLAETASLPHGTIGSLLTGEQSSVPCTAAHTIADAIGVDVLILFTPTGRSVEDHDVPALTTIEEDTPAAGAA